MSRRLPYTVDDPPPLIGTADLPLFARPAGDPLPVHHDDPPAAKRAALERRGRARAQREEAFETVDAAGLHGAVHTEVDDARSWPGGTANRRLCELAAKGHVVRLTEQRLTKHNAWAHVYVSPRHVAHRQTLEPAK